MGPGRQEHGAGQWAEGSRAQSSFSKIKEELKLLWGGKMHTRCLLFLSRSCVPVNQHGGISLRSAPRLLHRLPDALSVIGVI